MEIAPACSFRKRALSSITTRLVFCFFGCWRILRNKGVDLGLPVPVSLFKQNAQRVPAHRPYLAPALDLIHTPTRQKVREISIGAGLNYLEGVILEARFDATLPKLLDCLRPNCDRGASWYLDGIVSVHGRKCRGIWSVKCVQPLLVGNFHRCTKIIRPCR